MKELAWRTARSHSNAIKVTKEDSVRYLICKSAFKETGQLSFRPKWILPSLLKMPFLTVVKIGETRRERPGREENTTKLMHHLKKNHQDMEL